LDKLISIIVPVYNAEKYLPQCLDSILAQSYPHFELILVNDGSPDGCLGICREYEARDSRISVIDQPNSGASTARNTGIDHARGAYISFVDSDDYISPDYLKIMYEALERTDADVCISALQTFYDGISVIPAIVKATHPIGDNLSGKDILRAVTQDNIYCVAPCNKLYKKSLFHTVRFPDGRTWGEDNYIFPHIFNQCGKVVCLTDKLYYYRQRPGSSMHSAFSVRRLEDALAAWLNRIHFYEAHDMQELLFEPYGGYVQTITQARALMDFENPENRRVWREKKREFNKHCFLVFRSRNFYAIVKFYSAMLFPLAFARLRMALDKLHAKRNPT